MTSNRNKDMFANFVLSMKYHFDLDANKNADNSINWDFIDADMYAKWCVLLDGKTYVEWFDKAADAIESGAFEGVA